MNKAMLCRCAGLFGLTFALLVAVAQTPPTLLTPPAPPTPAPAPPTPTPKRIILIQPPAQPFQPQGVVQTGSQIPGPVVVGQPVVPAQNPDSVLKWDADTKTVTAKPNDSQTEFTFNLTNISTAEVLINSVHTSCGCTVAKLPQTPWRIPPGGSGPITATMNLAGKMGTVSKGVTVSTSAGMKNLTVISIIPPPVAATNVAGENMNRLLNMQMAKADRQAVFKGDCASCHVTPGIGKMGKELYAVSCGICHDSTHRAAMVPDLYTLRHPTNADYWKQWITIGKTNTMMPAFAQDQGGPLTGEQIMSLVKHLDETITQKPAPAPQPVVPPATGTSIPAASPAGNVVVVPFIKPQ